MTNYTTPTITLTIEGIDLSPYDVYVSLKQYRTELTKTTEDITITPTYGTRSIVAPTGCVITFDLSQEETAKFVFSDSVEVQVNWIDRNGKRSATEIQTIKVMRNLLDEVINDDM